MAHAVVEEPVLHMGPPIPNGKLAMWIFLATEVMFFTGLIGVYIVLRNGTPTTQEPWPAPHQVHLVEWMGALNTFVLICSSLTVVLAHWALARGEVKNATWYIAITLALGTVFLVIKAVEYNAKYQHDILPGHVFDRVDSKRGQQYMGLVRTQLQHLVENPAGHEGATVDEARRLLSDTELKDGRAAITPQELGKRVSELLEGAEKRNEAELHLTPVIPFGNLWSSCYFAMTGFHAIHVFGGLVIFAIILIMALIGRFGVQHTNMLEMTGLYWHFVDIVWIFLFPLLYLV